MGDGATTTNEIAARGAVSELLEAAEAGDVARIRAAVTDDVVYENVSLPTVRGGDALERLARRAVALPGFGFEAYVHRMAVDGDLVMTERTDVLIVGRVRVQFWVTGVHEVRDGRIAHWRDYFDYRDSTIGLVRGLLGAVVPPLGRRPRV